MPSNKRSTRQSKAKAPTQNDSSSVQEQTQVDSPVEGTELETQRSGEMPTPAVEAVGSGQEEQVATEEQNTAEADVADQSANVERTAEASPAAETPSPTDDLHSGLSMKVQIHTGFRVEDVVATADVILGDVCTIRNVKVKEDDYGLRVVMPRTKMADTGLFKDACVFHTGEMREQFDAAVKAAYQQTLQQEPVQGGMGGLSM